VPVRARDRKGQRNALCIYDDMPFGVEFSAVSRAGAGFLAPGGLATLAPSILARLQSIWPCSRSLCSRARCSFAQTPSACQSRSRRQHVIPLPKPSSCGNSSQGMSVCRTYKMPFNTARSSIERCRPPFREGTNFGIRGSSAFHYFLLTLRFAMHPTIPPGIAARPVALATLKIQRRTSCG